MKIRVNINVKVGRVVKFFVLSDLFFLAGRGFVDPIFSVFIIQKVQGANLATVGIVTALYLILRSSLQIPIANYFDRTPGEKDDLMGLIGGLLLSGFCPLALDLCDEGLGIVRSAIIACGGFRVLLCGMANDFLAAPG